MSRIYSVADARAHLPEILDQVEAGGDVGLSRRGRLVAVVLSSDEYELLRGARRGSARPTKPLLSDMLADSGFDADEIEALPRKVRAPNPAMKLRFLLDTNVISQPATKRPNRKVIVRLTENSISCASQRLFGTSWFTAVNFSSRASDAPQSMST